MVEKVGQGDDSYNISHVSLEVGDPDGSNTSDTISSMTANNQALPLFKLEIDIDPTKADDWQTYLKNILSEDHGVEDAGKFTEFAAVVQFNAVPGRENELKSTLDKIFTGDDGNGGDYIGRIAKPLRKDIQKDAQPSLSYKSSVCNNL